MKEHKLNKKGFTLIELLAVIVILAILITVSVPAITKYLATARKDTYATNALSAIEAVKNDYILNGYSGTRKYDLETLNTILEKKLNNSPYSKAYDSSSYIEVNDTGTVVIYSICLVDKSGNAVATQGTNALTSIPENDISKDKVVLGSTIKVCS